MVGVLYSKPRKETNEPGLYAASAIAFIASQSFALIPSANRQPPFCQVGQSYWPCPSPETACSVMHATSMPRARMSFSALFGPPSASPEMRLWLCRSVWTRKRFPPSFDRRDAPAALVRPPSVDPRAGRTANPPPITARVLRNWRRSLAPMGAFGGRPHQPYLATTHFT